MFLPLNAAAELVKKVDNFVVFIDQSGSMAWAKAQPGQQKFEQAVRAVQLLDKVTPELGYTGAVTTFAPYKTSSAPAVYKTGAIGSAAAGIHPPFNQSTPMGDGLAAVDSVLAGLTGKTALILYTDGVSNAGVDPVAQAKALYTKYAPNLCIHVVSYADTPQGENVIKAVQGLSDCSVVVAGASLMSDAAMDQFARTVLYDEVQPAPVVKPAPAPKPAPVVVVKEVITFNLLFDFDKSNIKDEMIPVLEQAKAILEEDPDVDFVISGHTDSIGTEAYNQGLSERRAASVKDWLVAHGVDAARLTTKGYGETQPKFDNSTAEGRQLNRRVEMETK
ncbi:MAG: OmpA family protein [Desulfuromonadales bacterium]